jgi:LysM repeat protein
MRKLILFVFITVAVVLLTHATAMTSQAAGPTNYYVVRHGDTLDWVAQRYGVSSWSLARANGIWNPNLIYVGQTLVIPGGYFPPAPNPCPWPGSCPPAPRPQPQPYACSYVVRYGDNMKSIAARYGVDVWTLARANNIYNLNWIYAGQWLKIPGCNPNPGPMPGPIPVPTFPVPVRRQVSGTWVSGNYSLELQEALGCSTATCAVAGRYVEARGTTTPDIVDVSGTIDVNSGAITIVLQRPGGGNFTGVVDGTSRMMAGQLSWVGAVTFTKR